MTKMTINIEDLDNKMQTGNDFSPQKRQSPERSSRMDGKSQENFGPGRKAVHYEDGAENDGQPKDYRIP